MKKSDSCFSETPYCFRCFNDDYFICCLQQVSVKKQSSRQQLIAEKKLAENELKSAAEQLNAFTQSIREKNELIEKASQGN
jgi:hypothetical protein